MLVYTGPGEQRMKTVGRARAAVWTGLEVGGRQRECKMYESIGLVYLVLVKGLCFVPCLTETFVRQLFWQLQYDWHPSSVPVTTGDFVVVSVGLHWGIDSYFCGRGNNCRAPQQLLNAKLRVHSCRGKEMATAHVEDGCLFFCSQNSHGAVCGT